MYIRHNTDECILLILIVVVKKSHLELLIVVTLIVLQCNSCSVGVHIAPACSLLLKGFSLFYSLPLQPNTLSAVLLSSLVSLVEPGGCCMTFYPSLHSLVFSPLHNFILSCVAWQLFLLTPPPLTIEPGFQRCIMLPLRKLCRLRSVINRNTGQRLLLTA